MSLEDIIKVKSVIPVDFFLVKDIYGRKKGAGVFYRGHDKIAQGIFVGDDMENRSLGIMDLLYSKIYNFYKELDYDVIDLGTSGVEGEPNVGLIRFKEIHNCAASLKFTFSWSSDKN
jgi:lipid II:glycine glycyltransferase (peptidoglycan interpeptide bridge formation enzyme)